MFSFGRRSWRGCGRSRRDQRGRRGRRPNPSDRRPGRACRRATRGLVQQAARPLQGDRSAHRTASGRRPQAGWLRLRRGARGPTVPRWPGGATRTTGPRSSARSPRSDSLGTRSSCAASRYDEMRPGCWRVPERLEDMDLNGVQAQLCFPNYPRFCGQQFLWGKDRELARLCVEAYNDWMVEEWCGESGGRLIPLCLVPLWDAELAAAEVRAERRTGACGRLPSPSCPPTSICRASTPGTGIPSSPPARRRGRSSACTSVPARGLPQASPDGPDAVAATILFGNSVASLADVLFSGTLHRFPDLRLMYAEAQIGWIPYVLERADDVWSTHRGWSNSQRDCPEPPSSYYERGNVVSCFFKDPVGVSLLDRIGLDNVVFETDYPHSDSTWPDSRRAAAEQFGHLDPVAIGKIARHNAIELLGLSLSERVSAGSRVAGADVTTGSAILGWPPGTHRWPGPGRALRRPNGVVPRRPRPPRASRASR